MSRTKTRDGIALGFIAGLAVAIACSARSGTSSRDAAVVRDVAADTAGVDTPTPVDTPVPDRLRVRTADTDLDQLVQGTGQAGAAILTLVASGPLVITDLWLSAASSDRVTFFTNRAQDCSALDGQIPDTFTVAQPTHGVRIVVKAGQALCADSTFGAAVPWTGYRPYPAN